MYSVDGVSLLLHMPLLDLVTFYDFHFVVTAVVQIVVIVVYQGSLRSPILSFASEGHLRIDTESSISHIWIRIHPLLLL